jgi:hypothetical protein
MVTAFLLALALAQAPAAAASDSNKPIVITGISLSSTGRNLEDCLRRHCPPKEDIAASLAHGENLFVAGDYEAARSILGGSVKRNARYGRQIPVEVADLYRASARVAAHLGEGDRYRSNSFAMRRTLTAGLPRTDARVIGSLFDLAQMHASLGDANESFASYSLAEKQANAIGRRDIAAAARLRRAWLSHLTGDEHFARKELGALAADGDRQVRTARIGALVLLAQLDRAKGLESNTEALIAQLRAARLTRPVLIFSPPVELPKQSPIQQEGESGNILRLMPNDNYEGRWIDVGFWVEPSGRVSDIEMLRKGGDSGWAAPLLKSIQGRIYAPLADPAGSYRVERYTYTSLWQSVTGTRLRQRSPAARIEYLDLTAEPSEQASGLPKS